MDSTSLPPKAPQLSETTENYLKRIYILVQTKGKARISDIAKLMGRNVSSVSEAVKRMAEDGLLNYEKYGKITLTPLGEAIAKSIHNNYSVLHDLLCTLGIPEHLAIEDACSMEHSISKYTIDTLAYFVKYAQENEEFRLILEKFKQNNPYTPPKSSDLGE